MNLSAAALAAVLVLTPAPAHHPQISNNDIQESKPLLRVIKGDPPLFPAGMEVDVHLTVYRRPEKLHVTIRVFKWPRHGRPQEVVRFHRSLADIPHPPPHGHEGIWWRMPDRSGGHPSDPSFLCHKGLYFSEWIVNTTSSTGLTEEFAYYFPYDKDAPHRNFGGADQPSRHESWIVGNCSRDQIIPDPPGE